ncbi:acetyl-CoA C-acyltransferase [Bacillus sp. 1P06AnD]|uniref:acetyl-CoA C-acyltransferase n=1 Tax=Bacillus sp. 1P06AnD TaxID=3132208 RepID=UPI0039A1FB39
MQNAMIVEAKRTPIGQKNGMLKSLEPHQLAAPLLRGLVPSAIGELDDIILGNVVGPGGNVARLSALEAGLPLAVPGLTIDRQCSSGLEAIRMACYNVQGGAGSCYIAGGVESASTSPFSRRARFSPDSIGDPEMGEAAEMVAGFYGISRAVQDGYAQLSYERSLKASKAGLFIPELVPLQGFSVDECFLKERAWQKLIQRAKPIFQQQGGTVTTVNSCGINDGASAVLVMSEKKAREKGYKKMLRFVDSEVAAVHPNFPGISPVPAIQALLKRCRLDMDDIDAVELNEAFAVKIVACAKELGISYEKLNRYGGALMMGHPYGASGAILVTRLFHAVSHLPDAKYVLAAVGSGGGIGVAVLFEVVS